MKGFTLIETMVAITIVTIAVAGPMFSASRAVVAAQGARYQLIASHLAQEGIEYVRLMRDDSYLYYYGQNDPNAATVGWNDFLTGSNSWSITQCRMKINSTNICTVDPSQPMGTGGGFSINNCSGSCTSLYLTAGGVYTQQITPTKTVFTRTIQTDSGPDPIINERIDSKVSWSFHGTNYSVTVSDHLTPWR